MTPEAMTIGSHPLADSRGQQDGEGMTLDDALDGIRRICSAVRVPVSADVESGYDTPAAELVERVLDAGAVGINVEDTVHSQGRVREVAEHADYIGALRQAADDAGQQAQQGRALAVEPFDGHPAQRRRARRRSRRAAAPARRRPRRLRRGALRGRAGARCPAMVAS